MTQVQGLVTKLVHEKDLKGVQIQNQVTENAEPKPNPVEKDPEPSASSSPAPPSTSITDQFDHEKLNETLNQPSPPLLLKNQTAEKIISLLSEIGSNQMLHDDFHPWFWEHSQGKLMTV